MKKNFNLKNWKETYKTLNEDDRNDMYDSIFNLYCLGFVTDDELNKFRNYINYLWITEE